MYISVASYLSLIIISLSFVNSQHTVAGKTVPDWLTTCKLNFHQLGEVSLSQVLRDDGFCEGVVCVKDGNNYGLNVQRCQETRKETKSCTAKFSSFPTCCNEELCLEQNNATKEVPANDKEVESKEMSSNESEDKEFDNDDNSISTSSEEESNESSNSTTEQNPKTIPATITNVTEESTVPTSDDDSTLYTMLETTIVPDSFHFNFTLGSNVSDGEEVNTENNINSTQVTEKIYSISPTLELAAIESETESISEQNDKTQEKEKAIQIEEKKNVLEPQSNQSTLIFSTIPSNYDYIISTTNQISEPATTESDKQLFVENLPDYYDEPSNDTTSEKPTEYATMKNNKGRHRKSKNKKQKDKTKKNPYYYFADVETTDDYYERKCKKDFLVCLSLFLYFIADDNESVEKGDKLFFMRRNTKNVLKSPSNSTDSGKKHKKVTWSDLYNEKAFRTLQDEDQLEAKKFYKDDVLHYNSDLSEVNVEEPFSRIPQASENGSRRADLEDPRELDAVEFNFK
ncbi:hypothetical protein ILUMI_22415 [Ignelater luminosus]|uniref:Uncharacterized protein n=1 Tax=Ignelater luminosus TaxID=2038154 RepID=A0A8K0CEI6_IGNLU|nr:hypothetical protein ILUMI_22415 [Ignelater luminosus]